MVGVRGRSRACVTCLRRRKGCDQQLPACGQCRKACIQCEGYRDRRRLLFVHNSQSTMEKGGVNRTPEHKPSTTLDDSVGRIFFNDALASKMIEMGHIDRFWRLYLPNGRDFPSDVADNITGGWIDAIQSLYRADNPLLRKILLSLALATTEGCSDAISTRGNGLRLYCEALVEASVAFQNPKELQSDGFLAAVRLFTLYESHYGSQFTSEFSSQTEPAQAENWLTHIKGDVSLLLARSPAAFADGDAHRMFVDGRFHLIFAALAVRKPTPIALPEWQTLPWIKHQKTPRDQLLDILADITWLVSAIDDLTAEISTTLTDHDLRWSSLLSMCLLADESLEKWGRQFAQEPTDYLPSRLPDLKNEFFSLTASPIPARELAAVHLMTLYWTTCLAVAQALQDLFDIPTAKYIPPVGLRTDTRECFKQLLRTLPFFFEPAVGMYRMHVASAPVHVAMRHLYYLPDEKDRVDGIASLERCLAMPEARNLRIMMTSLMQNCPADAKRVALWRDSLGKHGSIKPVEAQN